MDLHDVEPKQTNKHYKIIFSRNTNMVSEFQVLFSFSFLLFHISGTRLSQSDIIFFFLFPFSCFKFLAWRHLQANIIFFTFLFSFSCFRFLVLGFLNLIQFTLRFQKLYLFPGLLNNFEDNAQRNLTLFVKFLPLAFLPRLTRIESGDIGFTLLYFTHVNEDHTE